MLSSHITAEICDVTQQCFILGHYCIIIRNIMKFVLHYISYKLTRMQFSHSYTGIIKTLCIVFSLLSRTHIIKLYSFYTWKYFNQTLSSSLKFSLSFRNSFILYDFGIYICTCWKENTKSFTDSNSTRKKLNITIVNKK